jgi:hypothetical protein
MHQIDDVIRRVHVDGVIIDADVAPRAPGQELHDSLRQDFTKGTEAAALVDVLPIGAQTFGQATHNIPCSYGKRAFDHQDSVRHGIQGPGKGRDRTANLPWILKHRISDDQDFTGQKFANRSIAR